MLTEHIFMGHHVDSHPIYHWMECELVRCLIKNIFTYYYSIVTAHLKHQWLIEKLVSMKKKMGC